MESRDITMIHESIKTSVILNKDYTWTYKKIEAFFDKL